MIKIIGLTGGIGSGKTVVSQVFELMGIPVFNSDERAKTFYDQANDAAILLDNSFGTDFVKKGEIDKRAIASIVFNDDTALKKLNSIIHPWVKLQFATWLDQQNTEFVIREAAILIESGSYSDCHSIIHVSAPIDLRIKRTMKRNSMSREEVLARMDKQLSDDERIKYCQFEILNDDSHLVIPQIEKIYSELVTNHRG